MTANKCPMCDIDEQTVRDLLAALRPFAEGQKFVEDYGIKQGVMNSVQEGAIVNAAEVYRKYAK